MDTTVVILLGVAVIGVGAVALRAVIKSISGRERVANLCKEGVIALLEQMFR